MNTQELIETKYNDAELWFQFIDAFKRQSIHFLVKPIEVANVCIRESKSLAAS